MKPMCVYVRTYLLLGTAELQIDDIFKTRPLCRKGVVLSLSLCSDSIKNFKVEMKRRIISIFSEIEIIATSSQRQHFFTALILAGEQLLKSIQ
jgi:hypothetical protein